MGSTRSTIVLKVYVVIIWAFLLFPLLIVVPISFSNNTFLSFPPSNFGLRWYEEFFSDSGWVEATLLSLELASISSVVATFVGTLAVLAMERNDFRLKAAAQYFVYAPIIVPTIFIALGVFIFALRFGLSDNVMFLAMAHATLAIPFVVLIVSAAHRQLEPTSEMAARVMGAGPVRAFFAASFPALLPSIVASLVFAFFISVDELIVAEFLLSGRETLPMRIWANLRLELRPTLAAASTILIVATVLGMTGAELLRRRSAARIKKLPTKQRHTNGVTL
tara:strand:- start:459 stop:1292 length:834 start_codon:yes stop_codon:yes gene_type:complete